MAFDPSSIIAGILLALAWVAPNVAAVDVVLRYAKLCKQSQIDTDWLGAVMLPPVH